jgi:hypothetical protein
MAVAQLDFIARLADAWDGRGSDVLNDAECRALWALAYGEPYERQQRWGELSPEMRRRLVVSARHVIDLAPLFRRILG